MKRRKPYLIISGVIKQKNDHYAAICFELDIATQGETFEEAKRRILEAIEGYFEDTRKRQLSVEELLRSVPSLVKWEFLARWFYFVYSVIRDTTVEFFRHRIPPSDLSKSSAPHQPSLLNVR